MCIQVIFFFNYILYSFSADSTYYTNHTTFQARSSSLQWSHQMYLSPSLNRHCTSHQTNLPSAAETSRHELRETLSLRRLLDRHTSVGIDLLHLKVEFLSELAYPCHIARRPLRQIHHNCSLFTSLSDWLYLQAVLRNARGDRARSGFGITAQMNGLRSLQKKRVCAGEAFYTGLNTSTRVHVREIIKFDFRADAISHGLGDTHSAIEEVRQEVCAIEKDNQQAESSDDEYDHADDHCAELSVVGGECVSFDEALVKQSAADECSNASSDEDYERAADSEILLQEAAGLWGSDG